MHRDLAMEVQAIAYEHRQAALDVWRRAYNEERPHDALARVPPATYRAQITARSSPLAVSP